MPISAKYLFIVSMDVAPECEALFNEVYDREHVPNLLQVPGVRAVSRLKGEPFKVAIGGKVKQIDTPRPVYTALYEIDGPEVLTSPEWSAAVERGRWPAEVRPHTSNRRHALMRAI
ncbi:MAG: hypothetical protein ACTSVG_10295 [Alphaproteobacteria bacterium]